MNTVKLSVQTNRNEFIDFVKGISILFVLWGHCIQYFSVLSFDFFEDNTFKVIYSFHMPLFMLLSGYVSYWGSNRKLHDTILKRIKGIGVPLILWGCIDCILKMCMEQKIIFSMTDIVDSFVNIWFLWAVLWASIFVAIIHKLPLRVNAKYLIMFAVTIIFQYIPKGEMIMFVYPYYIMGFAFNEFKLLEKTFYKKIFQPISLLLWSMLLLLYKKKHFIYVSGFTRFVKEYGWFEQITINLYRYAIGALGCIAVIFLLRIIFDFLKKSEVDIAVIKLLGKNTLQIYVMQRIVVEQFIAKMYAFIAKSEGTNVLTKNSLLYDLVVTPILAILTGFLLLRISQVISRYPKANAWLFGRTEVKCEKTEICSQQKLKDRQYNYGLALLKIWMCFEVVCCHFGNGNENFVLMNILWKGVVTFRTCAVPCFVIMTFYFASETFSVNSKSAILKRMKRLFLPNLLWAIIYIFAIWISQDFYVISEFGWSKAFILQVLLGHVYNQTMWFQVDLIWLTCFYYVLYKMFGKKEKLLKSVLMIIGAISIVLQYSGTNYRIFGWLPDYSKYTLGRIIEIIPYSVVGLMWKKDSVQQNSLWDLVLWTFLIVISYYVDKIDILENTFGYAGLGLFLIGYCVTKQFNELNCLKISKKWQMVIKKVSSVTMGCYFMHRLVGNIIMYANLNIINTSPLIRCIVIFVVSMSCSYLLSLVRNTTIRSIVM